MLKIKQRIGGTVLETFVLLLIFLMYIYIYDTNFWEVFINEIK